MGKVVAVVAVLALALLWGRKAQAKPVEPFEVIFDPPEPDEPQPEGPTVVQVLGELVSPVPRHNRFYQGSSTMPNAAGNHGLLAQVLDDLKPGLGSKIAARLKLLELMSQGWNPKFYSRNVTTQLWPAMYNFFGINIGPAWLPRHENAILAMADEHREPVRTISPGGSKLPGFNASSYGLLWIPELDLEAIANDVVALAPRPDGSDPHYPPRALLDLLTGDA